MSRHKKKHYLSTAIVYLFVAILLFAFLFVGVAHYYPKISYTYDTLEYGEYTFERFERIPAGKGEWQIEIYVLEESEPLLIDILLTSEVLNESLEALDPGEQLFCYFTDGSQSDDSKEIVELRSAHTIFSLAQYTQLHRSDMTVGLIAIPIMATTALVVGFVFIVLHFRNNGVKITFKEVSR